MSADPTGPLLVRVTSDPLATGEALAAVAHPSAGASCVFVGTVRDHGEQGAVTGLQYEAWDDLAVTRLTELGTELLDTWPLCRVALLHRTGDLGIGEASVVVAVSAPHRDAAFEACRRGIEELKREAPIWKKEALASGDAHWIMGS